MAIVVWFRRDLRLRDNPALSKAVEAGIDIIPIYISSPDEEAPWGIGGASRWWLHHSLASLNSSLQKIGSKLYIFSGSTSDVFNKLIASYRIDAVYWNRRYEPTVIKRDTALKDSLRQKGITVESFNGSLLTEPWDGCKADKSPYLVYTPYMKSLLRSLKERECLSSPININTPELQIGNSLDSLDLLPKIKWDDQFYKSWKVGESAAFNTLDVFLDEMISSYDQGRDRPDRVGTSRISPHLAFGELSPYQIYSAIKARRFDPNAGVETYIKEIVWREFGYHLLFHYPKTTNQPLREAFNKFPWKNDKQLLKAWQEGQTGYPIVDAGMRELWKIGWMHNRVRMIVASFLVKDLLIPWQDGAAWFWDTLVDADLASNTLGWQWTAGCGADAAPYFRVFNPTLQGEKFDPEGEYVRRWVPELAKLPKKWIHRPFDAPKEILDQAGISLGNNYPGPIVEHGAARDLALESYKLISK